MHTAPTNLRITIDKMPRRLTLYTAIAGLFTATSAFSQQVGQPDTAPARERGGAQQGTGSREQIGSPDRPLSPVPTIEALKAPLRVPIPTEEMGIAAGPFQLFPDLRLDAAHNTNIFATRTGEVHDLIWTVTPSLIAKSETDAAQFTARVGASSDRYQNHSAQNTDDYWLEGQGLYQLNESTNVYAGAGYNRLHEDRGSPDLRFGAEPTTYTDTNAFVGMFHDAGSFYGRVGATHSHLNFDDVPTSTPGVMLINTDRNRDLDALGGRIGYRATPTIDLFAQASSDRRSYRSVPDDAGYTRNSDGYRAAVGAALNIGTASSARPISAS